MDYAQTIAMASDLLADGRAEDVVQMVEPLLAPIDDPASAETGQVLLHALMARVQVIHRVDVDAAFDLLDPFDASDRRDVLSDPVRAEVALWLGWAHARRNAQSDEEARALSLLDEAYELFRVTHAPHGRCWALIGQALAYFAIDEYHLMRRALDDAWSLHVKLHDEQARRWLHDLSVPAQRFQGHYDHAQRHVDALRELDDAWDDRRVRGHAAAHQAALDYDLGRPPDAVVDAAERAESLLRRLDGGVDYPLLAAYHAHVGALLRRDDVDAATDVLDEAREAVRSYPIGQAHLQTLRARLALRQDAVDEAERLMEDLFERAHHLPHGLQRSHVALLRGQLLHLRGDSDGAHTWMQRAYRNARETGHRGNQLRALLTLAQSALDRGDRDAAATHLDATAPYDDYFGVLPYAVLRFQTLGAFAHASGDDAEARTAYGQALSAADLIGDVYHRRQICDALASLSPSRPEHAPSHGASDAPASDASSSATSSPNAVREPSVAYHPLRASRAREGASDRPHRNAQPTASASLASSDAARASVVQHLASALATASLSVRLVAEAWIRAAEPLLPDRWIAVLHDTGDASLHCVQHHGTVPDALDPQSVAPHDERLHWLRLHDDPPFFMAVSRRDPSSPESSSPESSSPESSSSESSSPLPSPTDPDGAWADAQTRLSPWRPVVQLALDRALLRRQRDAGAWLPDPDAPCIPVDGFVCESAAMTAVARRIRAIHASHSPVLVTGERGTGKSLVARAVHATSERAGGPWVVVRCASMQQEPLADRLFGRVDDGGTLCAGAVHDADGGTLLLQDVDALPLPAQAKLVRMLESGEVFPVGADASSSVDVRVVATTSTDLRAAVKDGRFREDFYFHLAVLPLRVPPLRQRREDIPLLVRHFLDTCGPDRMPTASITNRALDALLRYDWPGNVRQLRNEIERALVFISSEPAPTVDLPLLSDAVRTTSNAPPDAAAGAPARAPARDDAVDLGGILDPDRTLSDVMARTEKAVIERVLDTCNGQVSASADVLGLTRQGLYKKMKRLGIDASAFQSDPETASTS